MAEESGLIVQLTQWAVDDACRQLAQWRARFPRAGKLFVNVNIAGADLAEPQFAQRVRNALLRFDLPPACLTLEITETTLMQQFEAGSRTLARLREIGVGLSVDDFGTGYSSLSHLSRLPINSLKIDRSFVARLDEASGEAEIVRAVVQLGRALGKKVIAEGVETARQLQSLQALGCGHAQGCLLGRPMNEEQVATLLGAEGATQSAPGAADIDAVRRAMNEPVPAL